MPCHRCGGSRKISRPKTADHILTDTEPWEWCSDCTGPAERAVRTIESTALRGVITGDGHWWRR